MPVIINEFEIVSEPPGGQQGLPGDAQLAPPKPNLLPQEVEAVLAMYQQRCARVRAD